MRITDNQQPLSYIREFRVNVLKNTIAIDDKQLMVFIETTYIITIMMHS